LAPQGTGSDWNCPIFVHTYRQTYTMFGLIYKIIFFWVCKEGATRSKKEEQGLGCNQLLLK
jgi:hypothetical protein